MELISLIENAYFNETLSTGALPSGCLFLTFLLGIHWGSVKILSKGSCLGWKPPGTFWEQNTNDWFFFFWLLGRDFSILSEHLHHPSSTHTDFRIWFVSSSRKNGALPLSILFQRVALSQPQQPCQEKKRWKARVWATLTFQEESYPGWRWKREAGRGRSGRSPGFHVMTSMPVTKGLLPHVSTSSHAFGARHSLEVIGIPAGTPWKHVSGNYTWKIQPV